MMARRPSTEEAAARPVAAGTGSPALLAVALGLGLGLGEFPLLLLRRALVHRWIGVGLDALWLAPLTYAAVFLLLAVPLQALLRRTRFRAQAWALTAGVLVFTAAVSALFIFHPTLHKVALLLLAAGVTRLTLGPLLRGWSRVRIPTVLLLALLTGLAGGGVTLGRVLGQASLGRAVAGRPAVGREAPNVLLLILDTVRAANLSLYGYRRPTTPALSRLAERGVTFERAYSSAPWTLPSHATIFTGRHPHQFRADWWQPLHQRFPTLAEVFQRAGYATAGFVANTVNVSTESGLARGFDHYEDHGVTVGDAVMSTSLGRALATNRLLRRLLGTEQLPDRKEALAVNAEALAWIGAQAGRPWFAFLNYFDAHQPYAPSPAFAGRFGPSAAYPGLAARLWNGGRPLARGNPFQGDTARMIAAYDASIAQLDSAIGELLDQLPTDRPTIVVVTADHGEEFGEHGWFEHGLTLYPMALHVPLVVVGGAGTPAGRRIGETTSLHDLATTIADLAGLEAGNALGGRSLDRYWEEGSTDTLALAEVSWVPQAPPGSPVSFGDARALIRGDEEFIWRGDSTAELVDLGSTPAGVVAQRGLDPASSSVEWYTRALQRLVPDSLWRHPKSTGFSVSAHLRGPRLPRALAAEPPR